MSISNGSTDIEATIPSLYTPDPGDRWTLLVDLRIPFWGRFQIARRPAHWTPFWSYERATGSLEVWTGRYEFLFDDTRAITEARRAATLAT